RVAEHATAHAQDHRPVQPHQGREGRFVPAADKALQQLRLCHPCAVSQEGGPAQLLEDAAGVIGRHVTCSVAWQLRLLLILEETGRMRRFFPKIFLGPFYSALLPRCAVRTQLLDGRSQAPVCSDREEGRECVIHFVTDRHDSSGSLTRREWL